MGQSTTPRVARMALVLVATTSCGYFDEQLYKMADAGPDNLSDASGIDVGPIGPLPVNECGSPAVHVITASIQGLTVDTNAMTGLLAPSCSGNAARGKDGFFALDVVAGEYWHIHLQPDPSDPDFAERDPSLYLLTEGCDERACTASSDRCTGSEGEHFSFVARSTGRWYVGIDDRNAGGGRYLLDAIHPTCGANGMEHGEACDDGNLDDGDGCDHLCRSEITEASRSERLPNDTPVEANVLRLPTSNEMVVSGDVGGPACFPDYFALRVPDGASLRVTALDTSELPCASDTTARFGFTLLNADLSEVGGRRDVSGCPVIDETSLGAGEYLIRIDGVVGEDRPELYRMHVRITP